MTGKENPHRVRCRGCGKVLAERLTAPWLIKCVRCKKYNAQLTSGALPDLLDSPTIVGQAKDDR